MFPAKHSYRIGSFWHWRSCCKIFINFGATTYCYFWFRPCYCEASDSGDSAALVDFLSGCGHLYKQYIDAFMDNAVDMDVLQSCSHDQQLFDDTFSDIVPNTLHRTIICLHARRSKVLYFSLRRDGFQRRKCTFFVRLVWYKW